MAVFELTNILTELHAAIDLLKDEPLGEETGPNRVRNRAIDHVSTALLLLQGSTTSAIVGHPARAVHYDETLEKR